MERCALRIAAGAALAVATVIVVGPGAQAGISADRPSLSAIAATFDEAKKTTFYEVHLLNPEAGLTSWGWDLEPPADDPTCRNFSIVELEQTFSRAEWRHGAEDGCRHEGTEHLGRVTVRVSTGAYSCHATIVGTLTRVGPEPDPCFRPTPPPPPPKATSPPSLRDIEKKGWEDAAKFGFGGASALAALAFGCAVVPSPDPVTKGIALFGMIVSVGYFAYGEYALSKALDPPDRNYKKLAKLAIPHLPAIQPGSGVTAAEAGAANALLANASQMAGIDAALLKSFERAQGAYAAQDGTWDTKQSRSAAKFARAEAKLLDARPALEAALRRAVAKAGTIALTPADVKRGVARIARAGFPSPFVSTTRRLGIAPARLSAFRARVVRIKPAAAAGPVAPRFAPPATAAADRAGARLLRALAARLDKR
jgi:hypothetical protein